MATYTSSKVPPGPWPRGLAVTGAHNSGAPQRMIRLLVEMANCHRKKKIKRTRRFYWILTLLVFRLPNHGTDGPRFGAAANLSVVNGESRTLPWKNSPLGYRLMKRPGLFITHDWGRWGYPHISPKYGNQLIHTGSLAVGSGDGMDWSGLVCLSPGGYGASFGVFCGRAPEYWQIDVRLCGKLVNDCWRLSFFIGQLNCSCFRNVALERCKKTPTIYYGLQIPELKKKYKKDSHSSF